MSSHELCQMRLVWWWRCLLLVSLLVGLHIVEGLQHSLHKLILGGDQSFEVDIVVGVVVAGLTIALVCSPSDGLVKGESKILRNPTICTRDRGKMLPFYLS
jgi:hypothetical protein